MLLPPEPLTGVPPCMWSGLVPWVQYVDVLCCWDLFFLLIQTEILQPWCRLLISHVIRRHINMLAGLKRASWFSLDGDCKSSLNASCRLWAKLNTFKIGPLMPIVFEWFIMRILSRAVLALSLCHFYPFIFLHWTMKRWVNSEEVCVLDRREARYAGSK